MFVGFSTTRDPCDYRAVTHVSCLMGCTDVADQIMGLALRWMAGCDLSISHVADFLFRDKDASPLPISVQYRLLDVLSSVMGESAGCGTDRVEHAPDRLVRRLLARRCTLAATSRPQIRRLAVCCSIAISCCVHTIGAQMFIRGLTPGFHSPMRNVRCSVDL
jgi:hypothetical protein